MCVCHKKQNFHCYQLSPDTSSQHQTDTVTHQSQSEGKLKQHRRLKKKTQEFKM